MPASSHASLMTVCAASAPAAMPPPTRLSSRPGSIAFASAAPCDPHPRSAGRQDEPVHVHRVGVNAEEPRRRALEQKQGRGAERRGDRVGLVSPRRQLPGRRQRQGDPVQRAGPGVRRGEGCSRTDAFRLCFEHIAKCQEPRRARVAPASRRCGRRPTVACTCPWRGPGNAQGAHELTLQYRLQSSFDCSPPLTRRRSPRNPHPHDLPDDCPHHRRQGARAAARRRSP